MTIQLTINDDILNQELVSRNTASQNRVAKLNSDGLALQIARMAQISEAKRVPFVPQPDPTPLTLDQLVASLWAPVEKNLSDHQRQIHLSQIASASTGTLNLITKVLSQPQDIQDKLAAQVAAL